MKPPPLEMARSLARASGENWRSKSCGSPAQALCPSGKPRASSEPLGIVDWLTSSKASLNPAHSLKTALDEYLVKRKLVDDRDHRLVKLDDELGRAVGAKNPTGQVMARDEVLRRLRAGVTWSVSIGGTVR